MTHPRRKVGVSLIHPTGKAAESKRAVTLMYERRDRKRFDHKGGSVRPMWPHSRGWRPADAIVAARRRAVVVARSKRPECVGAVRCPIVWRKPVATQISSVPPCLRRSSRILCARNDGQNQSFPSSIPGAHTASLRSTSPGKPPPEQGLARRATLPRSESLSGTRIVCSFPGWPFALD